MSEKVTDETESSESEAPEKVAIEGKLPLTAIDIESQKDMKSGRYHALRGLHKWFAGRPTPAARLAVLASAYPGEIESDKLLNAMSIGPKAIEDNISEYVEKRFAQDRGNSTIDEHYGYPNPNTTSPSTAELRQMHDEISDAWGGELPTVLDPTAGRGIIPYESIRYGFPTVANELNPIPSVIIKAGLEYAPTVGSIESEVKEWSEKIHQNAKENIEEFYPTKQQDRRILSCACTYIISCTSCGGEIPLTSKWWLNKSSSGGAAVKPVYTDGEVEYEFVNMSKTSKSEYDPDEAPVSRGDAECPYCGVVTEENEIREDIREDDFEYSVYGVNYETETGDRKYRAGDEIDELGMERAAERVQNDFDMLDYLSEPIERGLNTSQIKRYGMGQWRDIFTPRQLVVHYEYYKSFDKFKQGILSEYEQDKAEAILTLLTLGASRAFSFNSRLSKWYDARGYPDPLFTDNNYAPKKMFGDNNLSAPRRGYKQSLSHVLESYEQLAEYDVDGSISTYSQDAATLSSELSEGSVDIAVVDPPYYSSIMYSELSEGYYVIQKRYLQDVFPDLFDSTLPNKEDEAVANPSRFEELSGDNQSKKELANQHYEKKMNDIFSEIFSLLNPGGVMTVMFTHRDMDAWDTLTTALIEAGFVISATHPIKTEKADRIGVQGKSSADSSILLVARKSNSSSSDESSLWKDVADDIGAIAEEETQRILESGYNISKTDTAIAVYGPTLQRYAQEHPVVDKKGEPVRPREALTEARKAVTSVIAEKFLLTEGIDQVDSVTRWYILAWLIYENDTMPYDEGRQLGVAAGVDIDEIKRPTKLWRGGTEITLQQHDDRVQDVVMLKNDSVDSPSSRKYPVNPTNRRFSYTIDAVHSAVHIYEREGPKSAWGWLTERNMKSNNAFKTVITALLEVLPEDNEMHETLVNLISGQTGEYLDINVDHIDMSGVDRQTSLGDHG
jgi:adenine-specific DNA methylase